MASLHRRIFITVRGNRYETNESTLQRFPLTLLGDEEKLLQFYDQTRREFIFDRDTDAFDSILFYYQSGGCLAKPPWLPIDKFIKECNFFQLSKVHISRMTEREGHWHYEEQKQKQKHGSDNNTWWHFFEHPDSSQMAKLYSLISVTIILVAVSVQCMITIPEISDRQVKAIYTDPWILTEMSVNIFFFAEYTIRFAVAPSKLEFLTRPLVNIDIVTTFLYLFILFTKFNVPALINLISFLKMFRVLRLLRFAKQCSTLSLVSRVIHHCIHDMLTFLLYVLVFTVVSASIEYYAETNAPESTFKSIPDSLWWTVQTLMTLGYGDMVPTSISGKIFGAAIIIFGSITVTVPLLSIAGRYLDIYSKLFGVSVGPDL